MTLVHFESIIDRARTEEMKRRSSIVEGPVVMKLVVIDIQDHYLASTEAFQISGERNDMECKRICCKIYMLSYMPRYSAWY